MSSKLVFNVTNQLLFAIIEGSRAALSSILAHPLRSALTTLGMIVGVASITIVVAIMNGLSGSITKRLDDLGSDVVTIRAYTTQEQQLFGQFSYLSFDDLQIIKSKVKNLKDITATMQPFSFSGSVIYGKNSTQTQIIGTDSSYQNVVKVYPELGRFLSESDDKRRRRVAILGKTVIKDLLLPENPVGEFINLNGEWFRIIGVAEERGTLLGFDQDNYIVTPFNTMRSLAGEDVSRNIDIMFRPESPEDMETIKSQITSILRKRHKLRTNESDDFEFITAEKTRQQFATITNSVTAVAGGLVGISLLVGGIGIMNILLVSVNERTREIGTAKAIGAPSTFILIQFLFEALILSVFGGVIGLVVGFGISALLVLIIPGVSEVIVPMWAILLSMGFTIATGIVFGLAPALKAAKLNPIDALRYE